ncbi:unnamed protein product [Paramecium octaurelia]|uniref:Uncharacterized protein n=1 Tax=Paramecium octaurelia TaxID=43137 RepID=A0A8S1U1C1_PAROT|nr:unnamed protein product [Paramecium octaurelia]
MIFTIFGLLTIIMVSNCVFYEIFEDFNNNSIKTFDKNWTCEGNNSIISTSNIYSCKNEIYFIRLENNTNHATQFNRQFKSCLLIIRYSGNQDNIRIIIDQNKIIDEFYGPYQDQRLGKSVQCDKIIDEFNYQLRKTKVLELPHASDQINIQLQSNANENTYNEQYLFRNVQIFVNSCYKTCKTCVNDQINGCSTCYNNGLINSTFCDTCSTKINERFLLIPDGCVSECPIGFSYDVDQICYKNSKLIPCLTSSGLYQSNSLTNSSYSCDLNSSAIELRFRFTFTNSLTKQLQVNLGDVAVATIQGSILIANSKSKVIIHEKQTNTIRVEISTPISAQKEIINFISEQSIQISDMVIEYLVCEENCEICKDEQNCQVCINPRLMFEGKCVEACPDYTYKFKSNCYIFNQNLYFYNNLKMQYVFREFYDLSTRKDRVNDLFILDQSNKATINQYNFQKGEDILFSYLPYKRILGGPFVWVNAKFKFQLKLPSYKQILIVTFELYQGDYQLNRNYFRYQINNLEEKTIILLKNTKVMNDQHWNDSFNTFKMTINQSIFYEESNNNSLNIQFQCDNNYIDSNQSFCAISNFFIVSLTCQSQFQLDFYKYNSNENPCVSFCGDGQIAPDEECDDGNLEPFDGCFNCLFQCNEQCEICTKGDCLRCNVGYYLNQIDKGCYTKCGDSIIQGNEQCDDGNLNNYDGCSECQLIDYQKCDFEDDISKHNCSVCHFGTCLKCVDGFFLEDGNCISYCGDGLINQKVEQCDNQDDLGCINCKIQKGYVCTQISFSICKTCSDDCIQCQTIGSYDVVCKSCQQGYYPVDHECKQCDLNCVTCQNQSFLCTSCFRPDCEFCETTPGLYKDQKLKQCVSKCGDGILIENQEQCDDGNTENGDGCNEFCSIEFSDLDFLNLQSWSLTNESTYDLKLANNTYNLILLCNTSDVVINGFQKDEFNYNVTIINEICRFEFSFLKSIYQYNTILIALYIQVNQGRQLFEDSKTNITFKITPNEQIVISGQEQSQAEQITLIQQHFSLIFLILIPISIITNLFDYLWAVLEILSWVNNFYFFNVKYPFNVEVLLLNSDWSSFVNFPTYQELNQPGCDYYFQAPKRFQDKGIDPLFINNAQIPFMFILSALSLYLINYILLVFFTYLNLFFNKEIKLNRKRFSIFNLQAIRKTINTQVKPIDQIQVENKSYFKRIITFLSFTSNAFKNKIKQTITLCLLDITLACMLQFTFSKPNSHIIVGVNQFMALFATGLILFQLFQSYFVLNIHKSLAENKQFQEKYKIYYENINPDDSFGYYYNFFGILRKIIYVCFLVLYYYIPILQALLCFTSTSIGFFLLCYKNPYSSKYQYILQLILDFNLTLIHLIIIIISISDLLSNQFIKNNIINLGWIIISLILFSIFIEVCSLIQGILKYFYNCFVFIINLGKKQNQVKEIKIIEEQKQNLEPKQQQVTNKERNINRYQSRNKLIEQK